MKSLHTLDVGVRRAITQVLLQRIERLFGPLRNHFNRPVAQVAYEAAQAESLCLTHDKPPEPDPLHSTAHDPAPGVHVTSDFRRRRTT